MGRSLGFVLLILTGVDLNMNRVLIFAALSIE